MNLLSRYKYWIAGAFCLFVIGLVIGAVRPKHVSGARPAGPPEVAVAPVEQKDVQIYVEHIGTLDGFTGRTASFHGYRSPSWPRSCKHNMQKRFCLSTFAATVTTILVPTAFEARFDLSRIICRKKPKNFLGTKTSTCTALDHAKPRAPVWRICCGNRDLAHL